MTSAHALPVADDAEYGLRVMTSTNRNEYGSEKRQIGVLEAKLVLLDVRTMTRAM
ncbi:hypothetical protein FS749_011595 [Ceratobasidium sp. UAMH 11750]|nr:hypothetical protein FS749_011595 [Ceratobasidium sp. UAMH 11750]